MILCGFSIKVGICFQQRLIMISYGYSYGVSYGVHHHNY